MTDNQTATPAPVFSEPTTMASLLVMFEAMLDQVRRERDLFLALVDERERMMGLSVRTAEMRKWYKQVHHPRD